MHGQQRLELDFEIYQDAAEKLASEIKSLEFRRSRRQIYGGVTVGIETTITHLRGVKFRAEDWMRKIKRALEVVS